MAELQLNCNAEDLRCTMNILQKYDDDELVNFRIETCQHVSGSDLASQDKLFEGAPVGFDTDANVSNESESEGDNSFLFENSSIFYLEPEEIADSLNDLDGDDDQNDLNDWDLYLVDEGLSVIDRQHLFRKRIAHWAVDSNVSRDSVNKLLVVFRTDPSLSFLPKNYKTLLGTPRKVNTRKPFEIGVYHGKSKPDH